MKSMLGAAYLYGVPCCSLILCIAGGCWWWQRKKAVWRGVSERRPLLSDNKTKRRVSNVIAKFESQERANKDALHKGGQQVAMTKSRNWTVWSLFSRTSKAKVTPDVATIATTSIPKKKPVERCPACRKTFSASSTSDIVHFQNQKVHLPCFSCCDCQTSLQHHDAKTIQQYPANVRVRYQCQACCEKYNGQQQQDYHKSAVKHKLGPVVIEDHEQGDTKETLDMIGDDLSEAVFFMHPKCCVCGGDFFNTAMAQASKGNWRYHQECWDSGAPLALDEMKARTKLLPAASAKYLPEQLILQLCGPPESTPSPANTGKKKKKDDATILTTLYFVWKSKEDHAKKLSREHKRDPMVTIPFSLDEQAPANPNFKPQAFTATVQQTKRQRQARSATAKVLTLPVNNTGVEKFHMKLLAEDEVSPRPPKMEEPVCIIQEELSVLSEGEKGNGGDDKTNKDGEEGLNKKRFLSAKLEFLKFGLKYVISMRIPLIEDGATGDHTEPTADDQIVIEKGRQVNLVEAEMSVTIWE